MAFEYGDMLQTIKDRQWALADIDWDAPGAELITDEQRPSLKQFMSDVVWIEHVGARAFAAMAPRRRSTRWVRFTGISTPKSSGTPTWSSLSCIAGGCSRRARLRCRTRTSGWSSNGWTDTPKHFR